MAKNKTIIDHKNDIVFIGLSEAARRGDKKVEFSFGSAKEADTYFVELGKIVDVSKDYSPVMQKFKINAWW